MTVFPSEKLKLIEKMIDDFYDIAPLIDDKAEECGRLGQLIDSISSVISYESND